MNNNKLKIEPSLRIKNIFFIFLPCFLLLFITRQIFLMSLMRYNKFERTQLNPHSKIIKSLMKVFVFNLNKFNLNKSNILVVTSEIVFI